MKHIAVQSYTPSSVIVTLAYQQFFASKQEQKQEFTAGFTGEKFCCRATGTSFSEQVRVVADGAEAWLKFQVLVEAWQKERGATSSISESVASPAYLSIIGLGPEAVPFLLKQLESEGDDPDEWFSALTAITGASPESPEDQGDYAKMAASWFDWAKQNGYAW
jgi:hypothetical protein